jgi:RHS repeat-associated protein
MSDTTGNQTAFYRYDAFGTLAVGTPGSAFGYAGQYLDTSSNSTGFYNMRARWYEPQTGSLSSRDPAFSQTDRAYAYAEGDPVNSYDPSGERAKPGDEKSTVKFKRHRPGKHAFTILPLQITCKIAVPNVHASDHVPWVVNLVTSVDCDWPVTSIWSLATITEYANQQAIPVNSSIKFGFETRNVTDETQGVCINGLYAGTGSAAIIAPAEYSPVVSTIGLLGPISPVFNCPSNPFSFPGY